MESQLAVHEVIDAEEEDEPEFTCEKCGGHDLAAEWSYTEVTTVTYVKPCECGEAEVAAERTVLEATQYVHYAWDVGTGPYKYGRAERVDGPEELEEIESEVYCPECADDVALFFEPDAEQDDNAEIEDEEERLACGDCDADAE